MRIDRRAIVVVVACGVLVTLTDQPTAVVNQIDGLVVPVQFATICPGATDGCVQTGLDIGEGINPPGSSANPLDAILDANTGPETFLIPRESGSFVSVRFRLLMEGADFENIFGWYNVGQPDKRYPAIFSCRNGARSTYEPPSAGGGGVFSGGYEVTIDFEAEFQAGRYLGNQVGFYLISPEGSFNAGASAGSRRFCATDPDDQGTLTSGGEINDDNFTESGSDDDNGFGRLYYTESELNNDGNYVHYLIYSGEQSDRDFYFAFEDLFRGGDNDYDDILVKVEGLIADCQPSQEICNGVDDNCNGRADENVFRSCSSICGSGQEPCQFSNDGNPNNDWGSCDAPQPQAEICNGLDDDCDGAVDDDLPGSPCSIAGCVGTNRCQAGTWVCDAPTATAEVCDGQDNDCNGQIDDGVTRQCTTACGTGTETCQFSNDGNTANDWVNCTAQQPSAEVCDGQDNDCNGVVDDGLTEGQVCTATSGCVGVRVCRGEWTCDAPAPQPESCDGVDNDCNGQIDDGVFRACSTACGVGQEQCQFSDDGNTANDWGNCSAPPVGVESCNGVDDDCDGTVDNNLPDENCSIGGCLGRRVCRGGQWVCDAPTPGEEICDGLDNNCNGQIDENLSRLCATECGFGSETCQFSNDADDSNDWVGCTAAQPALEVCDGVDNDCDGVVDNDVPGEGETCDHSSGNTCTPGRTQCVGGELICVGATTGSAEICDCKDNNCNGEIDEGDPCETGTRCIACGCRVPCGSQEFGCPIGHVCKEGFCIPDGCFGVTCGQNERCIDGECIDLCAGVTCRTGLVCQRGLCVEDNCYSLGCSDGQICQDNACVADPCIGVQCQNGEFCANGECKFSCGRAICGEGARCIEGECSRDPCAGVECASGVQCVEGRCDNDCRAVFCGPGRVCRAGVCVDDPCLSVTCVGRNETCQDGQCISPLTYSGQRVELLATGAGGVDCSVRGGATPPPWSLVLLLGVWAVRRRRG